MNIFPTITPITKTSLQQEVNKYSKKTFIDPSLLPQTREFFYKEISVWLEEDTLPREY